jgi:hypothetical protein
MGCCPPGERHGVFTPMQRSCRCIRVLLHMLTSSAVQRLCALGFENVGVQLAAATAVRLRLRLCAGG